MYDYLCAFIIGVVEGLTEYIPVSSTGHLILVGHMLGFTGKLANVFDVVIQFGAILSVVIVYKDKFRHMIQRENWCKTKGASCLNLAIAMFPACLVGLVGHGFIKEQLFSPMTVILGLVLGGLFMITAEKLKKSFIIEDVDDITMVKALEIGLFQCLSLWPGFSRSGSTIAGGLFLGISRKASADFSFIMAVPLMFMACTFDLLTVYQDLAMEEFGILAVGFVTSFLVAYVSILWFLKFLNTCTLSGFAYYRFLVAAVSYGYFFL